MINTFLHWLAHLLKWNYGKVVTFEEDGYICVAFECSGCKKIAPESIEKILKSELINE